MSVELLTFRAASLHEIHALRRGVLRPGHDTLRFEGDEGMPPDSWHFGAFSLDGRNLACLTLLASTWENQPALQLRGMAVAESWRGKGVGARLLRLAAKTIGADPAAHDLPWWCNARVEAVGFYERLGWVIASEEFMIETVGLHRKMTLAVAAR